MSSLTDEQKKRIEENRARALAKLAEKKSLARPQYQNNTAVSKHSSNSLVNSNSFNTKPQTFNSGTTQKNALSTSLNLSRFEYNRKASPHKSTSKGFPNTAQSTFSKNRNKTKSVNDALMKARVVNGTCVLMSKTRFKVVVGFHAKLIGVLKSIPSKCYDAQARTWNFLLEDYSKLMSLCKPLANEVTLSGFPKEVARLFLSKNKNGSEDSETEIQWDLIDKKLVDSLMPFQREGVVFSIKQNGRVLLADDMGLGKTIQAIAVAAYYRTKWPLLIVVPSSLRMTWRRALIRWLPSLRPEQVNVVLTGKDSPNVGLVNVLSYDLLVKKIRDVQKVGYKVIIVDECHAIKSHKTERTKAMMPLLKNHFGWDYSGSSNMEELQLILEECIMIRRLKKLVLDQLPSKTREVVYLDPSLIKEKSLAVAEKHLVNAKTKNRRSALLEYFNETSSVKATAVREYLTDLLEGGHKLIVFAHHLHMLDVISETLLKKKIGFIRIDGRTLSARRQHLCDQFQRDTGTRAAVLSLTAANTGLTLTAATCVVFAELFWNPGALVQAEDRAYRIGQKNSVVIHYLIARKTADDYLWPMIQKKLDVLSEAGLNKENFSDLDTKTFQDPKQRDLKDLLESMIEEFQDDDSFLEECLKDESCTSTAGFNTSENKKEKEKLWSEGSDGRETSQTSSDYAESSQGSLMNDMSDDCFDGGTNKTDYNANQNKRKKVKLWSERSDEGEPSQTSSDNAESSQASLMNDISEDWFNLEDNDDWNDLNFDALDSMIEPNTKRKRL